MNQPNSAELVRFHFYKISRVVIILSAFVICNQIKAQIPAFEWAKSFGLYSSCEVISIVRDDAGNIYVAGNFQGVIDLDPGFPSFSITTNGYIDIFILKLDAGGGFIWGKRIGGLFADQVRDMKCDGEGNLALSGSFDSTVDFDPSPVTATNITPLGSTDAFILRLTPNGDFRWVKILSGTYIVGGPLLEIDDNWNIFVSGSFNESMDMDAGPGTSMITSEGLMDSYIIKSDSAGEFIWGKQIGGSGYAGALDFLIDPLGGIVSTGFYEGTVDFDPGAGTHFITSTGSIAFVNKLDQNGNFVWVDEFAGVGSTGNSIQGDEAGNYFIAGRFGGTVDFNPGTGVSNLTSAGSSDGFLCKLLSTGNFAWAFRVGSYSEDEISNVRMDAAGNIYLTGTFQQTVDFDPSAGSDYLTAVGEDMFISKYNAAGNHLWALHSEGPGTERGDLLLITPTGKILSSGIFSAVTDFDPGPSTFELDPTPAANIFLLKLDQSSVGIHESVAQSGITFYLFQEPGESVVTLKSEMQLDNAHCSIYNALGMKILTLQIDGNSLDIDTRGWAHGTYYFCISSEEIMGSLKAFVGSR